MKVVYANRLGLAGDELPKVIIQGELILSKPQAYVPVLRTDVKAEDHLEACEEIFVRLSDEQDTRQLGLTRTMSTGDAVVFGSGKVFVREKNANWREMPESEALQNWRREVVQQ